MTPITSPHNEKLKEAQRLQRRRERDASGRFVAEGEDLLAAADAAGWAPVARFCAAGTGLLGTEVAPDVLARVSALGSGTRAMAIYEQRWTAPAGDLCLYLHGVGDPGNVGTILRSAQAFGATSVILGPGCADPYGPKAVRASMGAIFAVPVAQAGLDDVPRPAVALAARGGEPLAGPLRGPLTLVIGAEREGLSEEVLAACDRVAHIPILSESLNAGMAATVALYEVTRGQAGA